ncbi:MAG: D-alanyl-D-alanine carboxypeptidase [Bacteroidales bacterium]|nr:D-alanyl-D-alanine carboxypeptidase [Bacteroidales bacterium]HNW72749.1 D-alanyl-D-alanine carboxypeptidase [Bacteroidales bacterium]HPS49648.1 D-alanyl-D-alanine carboxypeptidase [Bacteroidales bacterium]
MVFPACRNSQEKKPVKVPGSVSEIQDTDHSYDSLIQALTSLQEDPQFREASIGYLVVDITSKDPVVVAESHARTPMIPASTLKIFVTGAALEFFGRAIIPEVMITNQMSVNWRSSKLLRKIGGKVYKSATTAAGARAILQFWSDKGVDTRGMYFYDGNGLSRNNAISPKQLVDALYVMRASPYFQTFYESLPLAGMTGTLHRAMKGSIAEGRIRAKTGTINYVKSFAGYCNTITGRKLIFSLIVNDYEGRTRIVKKKLESVLIDMAKI